MIVTQQEAEKAMAECGGAVGFQVIRTYPEEFCDKGCLAPGSSPHKHGTVTGVLLIGMTGTLELDHRGYGVRSTMIHPLSRLEELTTDPLADTVSHSVGRPAP